ncbi:unnamed protein product [Linum trigynum]|uniref:Uncharacterized protein n=1 Tax=Linum trigynum TaxID=586398 RepID=A0AAV2FT01_9ROSI
MSEERTVYEAEWAIMTLAAYGGGDRMDFLMISGSERMRRHDLLTQRLRQTGGGCRQLGQDLECEALEDVSGGVARIVGDRLVGLLLGLLG